MLWDGDWGITWLSIHLVSKLRAEWPEVGCILVGGEKKEGRLAQAIVSGF